MKVTREHVLDAFLRRADEPGMSSTEVLEITGGSSATVRRHLAALLANGELVRDGHARATRYRLARAQPLLAAEPENHATWSPAALRLRRRLDVPLAARDPVTYQRDFVDRYVPNTTWLMPQALADDLYRAGRMHDQQPAGTYARKVLEQLLIDLSWSSSRLEGNRYSLLATEELFKRGGGGTDVDTVMLLNHKAAIEFLVDAAPTQGLTTSLVRNLHAVLMQDLLVDSDSLGAIRQKVVNISDTVYVPTQVPSLLEEMLESVIDKARLIKNPIEAAFFLWVNLAYLQPFEDGNKRTSRLAANIPLMLYNCAPLSFLDVDVHDHARAMLGVYEFRDVSLASDLFGWAYRRSLKKYAVVRESLAAPDPIRVRYRESLTDAMGLVVRERKPLQVALEELGFDDDTAPGFSELLRDELKKLEVFNCGRYRLTLAATQAWIASGRPL